VLVHDKVLWRFLVSYRCVGCLPSVATMYGLHKLLLPGTTAVYNHVARTGLLPPVVHTDKKTTYHHLR
jgi:hypothetical protein